MGQQPSKNKLGSTNGTPNHSVANLSDTVPMVKTDTQGSTRSFRETLKSKISSSKDKEKDRESPTGSSTTLSRSQTPVQSDTSPTARVKRRSSLPSTPGASANSSQRSLPSEETAVDAESTVLDPANLTPPLSPVKGASVGRGHHALDDLTVDNVSDALVSATQPPPPIQQPKESILIKRPNAVIPLNPTIRDTVKNGNGNGVTPGTSPAMGMAALRIIDLDDMISRLLDAAYSGKVTKAVCLKNAEITAICTAAREVLLSQPSLVELSPPVKIVGDVHGQYTDLIRMFEMCGFPPTSNYLFLGDYVDRGKQSLETILLLMCYKLKFPENFFLLRGNHECANVTRGKRFYYTLKLMALANITMYCSLRLLRRMQAAV